MDLDNRKLSILQAIIEDYIATAMPIGSRTISKSAGLGLSSATIRNEMSDLEEMGYLEQPHTSAGRVPSEKAYRLYVDRLMQRDALSEEEKRGINAYFTRRMDEVEDVIAQTAIALSDMTKYTALVLAPQLHNPAIRRIQLIPVSEGRALAVVVLDDGIVRESFLRVPGEVEAEWLEELSRLLTHQLQNKLLAEADLFLMRSLHGEVQRHRLWIQGALQGIGKNINEGAKTDVKIGKTANILSLPEYADVNKARTFLSVLESKDTLKKLLSQAQRVEFKITIGRENELDEMKDCSIVTASYRFGEESTGSVGIIGPTRMDYSKVAAILQYMKTCMGDILQERLKSEE